MTADQLARLIKTDPHAVRAWVVVITAVDLTTGTCTIDPQDGDTVAEVPYWGIAPGIGSVQVALLFEGLLGVLSTGTGTVPVSATWPLGELAPWAGSATFPSYAGQPIYLDSRGQLRAQPTVMWRDNPNITDTPTTYPMGMSIMTVSSTQATAGGWPGTGVVVTFRRYNDEAAAQWWHYNNTGVAQGAPRVMYRAGNTANSPQWTVWWTDYLAGEQIPPSANLNNYIKPGQYAQTSNADATSGSNYPAPYAGMLEVGASDGGNMVWQRYTLYRAGSTVAGMTYQRTFYSATWSAWAITAGDPALPDSADTYVSNDQTISATSRYTETPTAVRAGITNPHLSRRMLCRVSAMCWVDMVTQGIYFDVINIAGVTWAGRQVNGRWENYAPVTRSYASMVAEAMIWVPAGVASTVGLSAAKTQSANASPTLRYAQVQIMPIRYE